MRTFSALKRKSFIERVCSLQTEKRRAAHPYATPFRPKADGPVRVHREPVDFKGDNVPRERRSSEGGHKYPRQHRAAGEHLLDMQPFGEQPARRDGGHRGLNHPHRPHRRGRRQRQGDEPAA